MSAKTSRNANNNDRVDFGVHEVEQPLLGNSVHENKLQHVYIAEEQSIYLLSHKDAEKLKQWVDLCKLQLTELGYQNITLLGKGAYGFVFNGESKNGHNVVFKFSRIKMSLIL